MRWETTSVWLSECRMLFIRIHMYTAQAKLYCMTLCQHNAMPRYRRMLFYSFSSIRLWSWLFVGTTQLGTSGKRKTNETCRLLRAQDTRRSWVTHLLNDWHCQQNNCNSVRIRRKLQFHTFFSSKNICFVTVDHVCGTWIFYAMATATCSPTDK